MNIHQCWSNMDWVAIHKNFGMKICYYELIYEGGAAESYRHYICGYEVALSNDSVGVYSEILQ